VTEVTVRRAAPLPDPVRAFLVEKPHFASIATIDPDGAPRAAVVWYTLDGDALIINSREGRRWPTNLRRDPRIGLSVTDAADGYRWIGLTGWVEVMDDRARALADISAMARRYHAGDPAKAERVIATFAKQDRVSFRIHVVAVHDHLSDD
jgi:PPOX class probable F420-dependent enzyme